jgi:hypothetical protein
MTMLEELRQAVLQGDYSQTQTLLANLPQAPANIEDVAEIRNLLLWALQIARINRAHDAGRLAALIRSSAYQPRKSRPPSTWALDA